GVINPVIAVEISVVVALVAIGGTREEVVWTHCGDDECANVQSIDSAIAVHVALWHHGKRDWIARVRTATTEPRHAGSHGVCQTVPRRLEKNFPLVRISRAGTEPAATR